MVINSIKNNSFVEISCSTPTWKSPEGPVFTGREAVGVGVHVAGGPGWEAAAEDGTEMRKRGMRTDEKRDQIERDQKSLIEPLLGMIIRLVSEDA